MLHLNTTAICLLQIQLSYSAGIDFRRQNLTSTDPRAVRTLIHGIIFYDTCVY